MKKENHLLSAGEGKGENSKGEKGKSYRFLNWKGVLTSGPGWRWRKKKRDFPLEAAFAEKDEGEFRQKKFYPEKVDSENRVSAKIAPKVQIWLYTKKKEPPRRERGGLPSRKIF